jgi:hypothetical protein
MQKGPFNRGFTPQKMKPRHSKEMKTLAILLLCAPAALAQTTTHQIALNYNYNGMVHAGESGDADNLDGYRSISDRGLDFTGGVSGGLAAWDVVDQAGVPDILYLGNRCVGTAGNFCYDATANGDCRGVFPNWMPAGTEDVTGVTTMLPTPITMVGETQWQVIFQISDGGGNFDFIIHTNGGDAPITIGAGDWFGGPFPGTDNFDCANTGAAGLHINLINITDNGAFAGLDILGITMNNPASSNAGYAILGLNIVSIVPQSQTPLELAYNYNGMVHTGEDGIPDDPNGYRSIGDRGLNVTSGSPAGGAADKYEFCEDAFALDIVHLGNRCSGPNGWICYDLPGVDTATCRGEFPAWLPQGSEDQTGPHTSILATPLAVNADSSVSVIFHITDGGGAFDVTCGFENGPDITGTVGAGDWFGGPYAGSDNFDCAGLGGAGLFIDEGSVNIGAAAGDVLTSITFSNPQTESGYAIFAANGVGVDSVPCPASTYCYGDGSGTACPCGNTGGACAGCANSSGTGATLSVAGTSSLSADSIVLTADGLNSNLPCLFFSGTNQVNAGNGVAFGDGLRCAGNAAVRIEVSVADANGSCSSSVEVSTNGQAYGNTLTAGDIVNYQCWYRENTALCAAASGHNLTNGLTLTWDA